MFLGSSLSRGLVHSTSMAHALLHRNPFDQIFYDSNQNKIQHPLKLSGKQKEPRLFNYGIGIHLLQSDDPESMPKIIGHINPKNNHISFQSESIAAVENKLKQLKIKYVKRMVEESGIYVDQLFFHDPDGTMIEVCNCDNIPVVPLSEDNVWPCSLLKCNIQNQQQQIQQVTPMQQQEPMTKLPSVPMNSCVQ